MKKKYIRLIALAGNKVPKAQYPAKKPIKVVAIATNNTKTGGTLKTLDAFVILSLLPPPYLVFNIQLKIAIRIGN